MPRGFKQVNGTLIPIICTTGIAPWNKGREATPEQKLALAEGRLTAAHSLDSNRKRSEKMRGEKNWNFGRVFSAEHREKLSISLRGKRAGVLSNLWKGGVTPINTRIRTSYEYKQWRKAVFERDDYRCYDCGERGGDLEADHIYPFSLFPRLRLMVENGRTLCVECHKRTPTYGNKLFWLQRSLNKHT